MKVVVTRARHQSADLVERLEAIGAVPVVMPVIDIVDPDDGGSALRDAMAMLASYDWLVVTSVNTVDRLQNENWPTGVQIAAIGPGTAERLHELGRTVNVMPKEFVAESLLEAIPGGSGRVLLPRAAVARDVLPEGLRAKGWRVDVVEAYKTVDVVPPAELMDEALAADVVTFTAPSTVRAFLKASEGRHPSGAVVCIGPITEAALREADIRVDAVAPEHTIEGLVRAVSSLP